MTHLAPPSAAAAVAANTPPPAALPKLRLSYREPLVLGKGEEEDDEDVVDIAALPLAPRPSELVPAWIRDGETWISHKKCKNLKLIPNIFFRH